MKEDIKEDIIENNEKIENSLKEIQSGWNNIIDNLSKRLNCESKEIVLLQSEVISRRQMVTDEITQMTYRIYKLLPKIKNLRKKRFEYYTLDYQIRKIGATDKTKLIEADLAYHDHLINIYESHIEFLRETLKNLDNINYAIKNKIELYGVTGLD